jgi:outer membrane protein assembly factor BamE (lipoprotein component of BamABCDE complex)
MTQGGVRLKGSPNASTGMARPGAIRRFGLAAALTLALGACGALTQTYQRGYILPDGALEQVPLGASQEQVLVVLGTPSTVATVSGEVFYYISQKTEQTSFMPQQEASRRIVAVYFDRQRKVERLADYGMKDGKIFDYVSRTTPSGGEELSYLSYMFRIFRMG